jgi:hypothetical protein
MDILCVHFWLSYFLKKYERTNLFLSYMLILHSKIKLILLIIDFTFSTKLTSNPCLSHHVRDNHRYLLKIDH